MLAIDRLALGDYQTNCYIVRPEGSRSCIVIDPGYDPDTILAALEGKGLTLEAIALTHCHFDHVGAVKLLAADTGCRVYLHEPDLKLPPVMTAGKLYYTDLYIPDTLLTLAGMQIRVLPTPGHTPGSVCLLIEASLFSGDTLFAGSCGRTDLPGGNWDDICASLQRLASLPDDLHVYPGHGSATTLLAEKKYNPYWPR